MKVMIDSCHKKNVGASVARMLAGALLLGLACASCGETIELIQATESGGIVTYPVHSGRSYLTSPSRREAFQLIQRRCAGDYTILREGEAKGRTRMLEGIGGQEIIVQRRWGIQFRCQDGLFDDTRSSPDS